MRSRSHNQPPRGIDICPNCHELVVVSQNGFWVCSNCGAQSARRPKPRHGTKKKKPGDTPG